MKTKLGIAFALLGVAGVVALIVLLILQVFDLNAWWVDYAFGVSVLLVIIPLNFRAAKKDEYYDALRNVKDARFALGRIDPSKRVGLLKLQAARGQLAELAICFREIVNNHDLYALQPLLNKLEQAQDHYKDDDDFNAHLTAEVLDEDQKTIDEVEKALVSLRENR